MGETTAITWCRHTFNLWIGCWKIDPECEACYAWARDVRFADGEHWGRTAPRQWTVNSYWKQLARWNRDAELAQERRSVFVGSLMDWAETHPVAEIQAEMNRRRARFFAIARECRWLDFLMLTKRIEDVPRYLPWYEVIDGIPVPRQEPWPNIWIGTTAGTRKTLREHAPELRNIVAAHRFISCEPMLEEIPRAEWDEALGPVVDRFGENLDAPPIDCLIVGGESGRKPRPMLLDWVRTARDAAAAHGVYFHFKQLVDQQTKKVTHLPILDGRQHADRPWSDAPASASTEEARMARPE